MLLPSYFGFKIVMFLPKLMLIYDKPPLDGQSPTSSQLLVPRGWPLNGGSTVVMIMMMMMMKLLLLRSLEFQVIYLG